MLVPPSSPNRGFIGQGGEAAQPQLPIMKGYPYPKMSNSHVQLVYQYERGELTAEEAAAQAREYRGSSVRVNPRFSDETQIPIVVAWLKSQGVPDSDLHVSETSFLGYVPVPPCWESFRRSPASSMCDPHDGALPEEADRRVPSNSSSRRDRLPSRR